MATELLGVLEQDVLQLGSPPFRAQRVTVQLGGSLIVFHRVNVRVRTRTAVQAGFVAYGAWGPRTTGSVNGLPIRSGTLLAAQAGTKVAFVAEPGYESVFVFLRPEEIETQLRRRRRRGGSRPIRGAEILRRDEVSVRRFFEWGKRLAHNAARRPELFNSRQEAREAAHVELLETLLATLGAATDAQPAVGDHTRLAHSHIVTLAEAYAQNYAGDHLYVADLCDAAQVSERALEYAFREIMGMTPVAYLTRVRLHSVRRALLAATRSTTTVSAEAMRRGFWHFGDFSRAYKDCFGELPSATLRRVNLASPPG